MIKLILLLLILSSQILLAQEASSKPLLAITELTARNITQVEAQIISDRLGTEIMQTGKFRIMERSQVNAILIEQGFQESGACDGDQCDVKIGQLLGVDRLLVGSIGKISDLHTINIRLIDVSSGEVLKSVSQDYQGELKGFFTDAIPKVASLLASDSQEASQVDLAVTPLPQIQGDEILSQESKDSSPSNNKLLWRITSGGVFVLSGALAYYYNSEAKKINEDATLIQARVSSDPTNLETHRADYEAKQEESDSAILKRNVAGSVAALGGVGFAYTFVF